MRGLLYNQFRTFRMPLICISVMSVVSLIATIGDSQNSYSEDFGFNACIIMPYIIFLLINAELFRFSENPKWRNFAISTPISVKGQVAVKYVFTIMIYAAILLFDVFGCFIATLMTSENQFTHMQAGLIFFGISLILNSFDYPFYFRFGSENGSRIKAASILFVIILSWFTGFSEMFRFFSGTPPRRTCIILRKARR